MKRANPGQLPRARRAQRTTLKDGEVVLGESLAIMAYLDRKHPAPPLFGATAQETAHVWQLAICAADIAVYPFLKSLLRAASKETAAPLDLGLLPFDARYPRLAAWMQRVERIPGYEKTYPPHWRQ